MRKVHRMFFVFFHQRLFCFFTLSIAFFFVQFEMHYSLPKSIEVLSFCIIITNDWTIETKAMLFVCMRVCV